MEKVNYQKASNKNGKIELLRFLFSILIILFHMNSSVYEGNKMFGTHLSLARHGNMGVEFFFLISGFLMAASITKRLQGKEGERSLVKETIGFLWKKVKGILPCLWIFCLMKIVMRSIFNPDDWISYTISRLPSFLPISRTGIIDAKTVFLKVDWYISSMLIAMLIIYPIARKCYKTYTHLIGPVLAILIFIYLFYTKGRITGAYDFGTLTYSCNLRAFAEISLGMTIYEMAGWMKEKNWGDIQRVLISFVESICYVLCLLYIMSDLSTDFQPLFLIIMTLAVLLTVSQTGLLANSSLFQNKACMLLGRISLPLYLGQECVLKIIHCCGEGWSDPMKIGMDLLLNLLMAVLILLAENMLRKMKMPEP